MATVKDMHVVRNRSMKTEYKGNGMDRHMYSPGSTLAYAYGEKYVWNLEYKIWR